MIANFNLLLKNLPKIIQKKLDINSSIDELKQNAKKFDPQEDAKDALREYFGEPKIGN